MTSRGLATPFQETVPASGDEIDVTPINYGVAAQDGATGSGFIMYSEESVHTRFSDNPPDADNSDHFIAVKYTGDQWYYDDDGGYRTFTPRSTDRLIAAVDFDDDTIEGLEGVNQLEHGIFKGYPGLFIASSGWGILARFVA